MEALARRQISPALRQFGRPAQASLKLMQKAQGIPLHLAGGMRSALRHVWSAARLYAGRCRDQGIDFDRAGFDRAMEEQKSRARASWKGAAKQTANPAYQQLPKSVFEGYRQTRSDGCEVLAIIHKGQGVQQLSAGESGEVILDHTPFYAESGGQVGDRGWFYSDDHNTVIAEVMGCYSPIQGVRAHQVVVKSTSKTPPYENRVGWGTLRVGDRVDAVVDVDRSSRDDAESYGHASSSCGVARSVGEACEAGRVAGGAESSAL